MDNVTVLNNTLSAFKIHAHCCASFEYKNASFYDIKLGPGGRVRDLQKYATEFALALRSTSKPRINVLAEDGVVRFEFLKSHPEKIPLIEFGTKAIRPKGGLTCLMGETLVGDPLWVDLAANPHMLVSGCTGSGKSTILHTIIANVLMYKTSQIYLMDPKNIEFFKYDDAKLDRIKVSYTYEECLEMLIHINSEMDHRYSMIKDYKVDPKKLPYIVLVIDEFADLRLQDTSNAFIKSLSRLAQKSRAARIHIVLATQRPSVNVVDGIIKASFPSRLSCKVASGIDSKVILDATGAEDLAGAGDSIINNVEHNYQRFQAAYITADEVCKFFGKDANI